VSPTLHLSDWISTGAFKFIDEYIVEKLYLKGVAFIFSICNCFLMYNNTS